MKLRSGLRLFAILAFGFGVACSSPTTSAGLPLNDGPTSADFRTDSAAYTLAATSIGYQGTIGVTFTNASGGTAYFENCGGSVDVELQKLGAAGEWQRVWSPILLTCRSQPIVVGPGAQRRFTISVFGGYPGCNCGPQFSITDIAGTYRAMWSPLRSDQDRPLVGDSIPLGHRVSNSFAIAVQSR